jgi:hypothetical protein
MARVQDISAGGLGILQDRTVPIGTMLVIELSNATRSFSRRVVGRVVHVTPQGETHHVGIMLQQLLEPDTLRAIVP